MLFNSFEFILFFPVVTLLFWALPYRWRWAHLLFASCIFYMAFVPAYILILFLTIIVDYIAGIVIENASKKSKKKLYLGISIIANIGVLAVFKYYNFFAANINSSLANLNLGMQALPVLKILLPIGLSFHTFQAMSYTIEVYRGHQKAERHFGIYALYVMFYPQLVAGPIERPQNILHQFHERQDFDYQRVVNGLKIMLWGLFKKVVIADRLAIFTAPLFDKPQDYPSVFLLVGVFFFTFQIFCDFSGYSDIAIGAAQVMGFKLMQNFNLPYHSKSISEFWKRWHISLSSWFRDYLYIPLGGNRKGITRWYFNLFFIFLVSGLWHGANWTFILWGAIHGFYLIFAIVTEKQREKFWSILHIKKTWKVYSLIQIVSTFALVSFTWIFFRANNISDALYIVKQIPFAVKDIGHALYTHELWLGKFEPFTKMNNFYLSFTLIACMEIIHLIQRKKPLIELINAQPLLIRWSIYYLGLGAVVFGGVFKNTQFIYFQF